MNGKELILLNGSPRRNKTSYSFTRTLKTLAEHEGHHVEIIHIIEYFDGHKSLKELKVVLSRCDILGLFSPLYVDSLPYPVIWFLEKLMEECPQELQGKGFFAVGQCGFPDATLCQPLLGSCRCFARTAGMQWLGGLGYGGGAMIDGAFLENVGSRGRKITAAFSLALHDLLEGRVISPKAQDMMTLKIPKLLYYPLAAFLNHRSKKLAKSFGVSDLGRKAYLE